MREELYGDSKLEDLQEFRHLGETLLLGADVCRLQPHVAGAHGASPANNCLLPPASAEPRLGALNKWKEPDET